MKILFLLPLLSDAYYQKRVNNLRHEGVSCRVFGFERNHYEGKSWPFRVTSLGNIDHGNFIKRIWYLLAAAPTIRKASANSDYIYAFNLDMLFLARMSTLFMKNRPGFIFDIADIHPVLYNQNVQSKLLRRLEDILLKKVKVIVVASPNYINGYFNVYHKNYLGSYHVIENKLNRIEQPSRQKNIPPFPPDDTTITIGYFGMIRCEQSLRFLSELLDRTNGSFKLYLRGKFLVSKQTENLITQSDYTEYGGPFINPDELSKMHNTIDLVWAAQQLGEAHTKFSRTNRFYQSCYFDVPMITQEGTQDDKMLKTYNLGITIQLDEFETSIKKLLEVTISDIKKWQSNIEKIPENHFIISDEYHELLALLKK